MRVVVFQYQSLGRTHMKNLLLNINDEVAITLKDITDFIGVQHSKAMEKVLKLAEEPDFGSVVKMDSQYESGKGRVDTIQTLLLTKNQAIAAAARLNNRMLMQLIKYLEEMEQKVALGLKEIEQFLPIGGYLEENPNGQLKTKVVRAYYRVDKTDPIAILVQRRYDLQKKLNGFFQDEMILEIEKVNYELKLLESTE